jgi:hypothetical protein
MYFCGRKDDYAMVNTELIHSLADNTTSTKERNRGWCRVRISLVSLLCGDNTVFLIKGTGYRFSVYYYDLKALCITKGDSHIYCSTIDNLRIMDVDVNQFWDKVKGRDVLAFIDGNAKTLKPEVRRQNIFQDEYEALFFVQETIEIGNMELASQMLQEGICVNFNSKAGA